MTAFDTDIVSLLGKNNPAIVARAKAVPQADRRVPIVVVEEVLRGQLATIRLAQTGKAKCSLEDAYGYLEETLSVLRNVKSLNYTTAAHNLFLGLKASIKIGSQDLRIACIAIVHGAKLATRNARDFQQVPGLNLEVWN